MVYHDGPGCACAPGRWGLAGACAGSAREAARRVVSGSRARAVRCAGGEIMCDGPWARRAAAVG